jgi:hypothetical protein
VSSSCLYQAVVRIPIGRQQRVCLPAPTKFALVKRLRCVFFSSRLNSSTCAIRKKPSRTRTSWTVQADLRYVSTYAARQGRMKSCANTEGTAAHPDSLYKYINVSPIPNILLQMLVAKSASSGKIHSALWPYISVPQVSCLGHITCLSLKWP